jgi:signal peptidase II
LKPLAAAAHLKAAAVLLGVVALDQLTKHIVRHTILPGEERRLLPGIEIVNTHNRGVAFGFLPGRQTLVTVLVALALLVLLVYFLRNRTRLLIWLPTGLVFGGALGNILDRARTGSVTDFVKLPLGWPPFNLADASITLGVIGLLILAEWSRQDSSDAGASAERTVQ